jgi:hypothetical protein
MSPQVGPHLVCLDISNLVDIAIQNHSPAEGLPICGRRESFAQLFFRLPPATAADSAHLKQLTIEPYDEGTPAMKKPPSIPGDRIEDWVKICRGLADHPQDLSRGRLLLLRFCRSLYRFSLTLQRLRQALLQVSDTGGIVLGRLGGDRGLGLGLHGLRALTHRPLPFAACSAAAEDQARRTRPPGQVSEPNGLFDANSEDAASLAGRFP